MKRICILLFSFLIALSAYSQRIDEVFMSIPDEFHFILDRDDRATLMELYKAGDSVPMETLLEGEMLISSLGDNYMRLVNGNLTVEIVLLSLINESKVICYIQTLATDRGSMSELQFYSTNWKLLDRSLFIDIATADWFVAGSESLPLPDISLMKFSYNPDNGTLTQQYESLKAVGEEYCSALEQHILHKEKEYRWNGISFQ